MPGRRGGAAGRCRGDALADQAPRGLQVPAARQTRAPRRFRQLLLEPKADCLGRENGLPGCSVRCGPPPWGPPPWGPLRGPGPPPCPGFGAFRRAARDGSVCPLGLGRCACRSCLPITPADHACRSVTPADLDLACWLQGQGPSKGCGDHEWKIRALPKSDKYVKSPAGIGRGRGDCPAPHTGKNKGRPSGERALPAPHCSPSRGRKRPGAVFQRRTPARRAPPLRRSRTPSRKPQAWA